MRDLVAENAVSRASVRAGRGGAEDRRSRRSSRRRRRSTLAENRLSYTRLVSDVAGVVTAQGAEPGEVVGAGRMIVQVAREGGRDAVFDVPARVKDAAPANAEITVVLTSDPKVTAAGVVREVAPRADPVTGTFRVRVRLINPPPAMRLGTTVTGRMKLASDHEHRDSAVRGDPLRPAGGGVGRRSEDRRWSRPATSRSARPIRPGSRSRPASTPGDVVVTAGVQALRPGQKVRLLETKQ